MINRRMIANSSNKPEQKNTKSSLITFLNSQFNTEYVNLILVSLTTLFSQDLASKNFENLIKFRGSTLVQRERVQDFGRSKITKGLSNDAFTVMVEKTRSKN